MVVPQDYFNFVCFTTLNQLFVAATPILKALHLTDSFCHICNKLKTSVFPFVQFSCFFSQKYQLNAEKSAAFVLVYNFNIYSLSISLLLQPPPLPPSEHWFFSERS